MFCRQDERVRPIPSLSGGPGGDAAGLELESRQADAIRAVERGKRDRQILDGDLATSLGESYTRSYQSVIRAQMVRYILFTSFATGPDCYDSAQSWRR